MGGTALQLLWHEPEEVAIYMGTASAFAPTWTAYWRREFA